MAIYHLEGKVISRSQGRSSVAASAYRAAERLIDERTGLTHDFTKKEPDLIHAEILLPKDAPEWMQNREKLWNHVEQIENRKDAQLAREFNIALPKELTHEQNIKLAQSFVQKEFVDQGMVADMCLHRGHKSSEEQPHVHVMLTLREITPEGFGQKAREWNDKKLIHTWRAAWADSCNQHLIKQGHDIQIDHRTLEAQGINLEPQTKIGPKDAGARMVRFEEHQRIAHDNGERILKDTDIALKAITHQQSTFTHQDLGRFVNRHTDGSAQFTQVYEAVKASPEMVQLGTDDKGRMRFTTQTMLNLESHMIEQATTKGHLHTHPVSSHAQRRALKAFDLSDEQQHAFGHMIHAGDVACVVGFAGTGKSTMLGVAREAWEREGYHVQGMTLSGIAAENLEGSSGIQSHTIANRLINWENDRERLRAKDILVIDEAGMVGSRQMALIMGEADAAKAKVVLIGDPEQLQAIEAGAAFRAIAERTGFMEMTKIRRQQEVWQQEATQAFALTRTQEGLSAYEAHDNIQVFNTKTSAMEGMIEQWDEIRSQMPDKTQIMLAYTRDEVRELNERARQVRRDHGELGVDETLMSDRGERHFATGDRMYFLRNEKSLGVKNGTLGTIEALEKKQLTVRLDGGGEPSQARRVTFHIRDYAHIEHGYAATVHKAQGVTVDRSHVLASRYFDRHTAYVAMSRHRDGAMLYYHREDFPSFQSLSEHLNRERSKDVTLDYAQNRSFDVSKPQEKEPQALSPDRLKAAEARLAERQYERVRQHEIGALEKKTGLAIRVDLKEGDRGIYRGLVEVAGRYYGLMEQKSQRAKLIPAAQLESRQQGKDMVIEKQVGYKGREQLKGVQPQVRERNRSRERGLDIGGL